MLITILYSLIRDDICWNEQVADSHWALLRNAGIKGSPASYLALKIGQPTGLAQALVTRKFLQPFIFSCC